MTLSSWSTSSVEEVNLVGLGIRFFQLYVSKDRNIVLQLVKRAEGRYITKITSTSSVGVVLLDSSAIKADAVQMVSEGIFALDLVHIKQQWPPSIEFESLDSCLVNLITGSALNVMVQQLLVSVGFPSNALVLKIPIQCVVDALHRKTLQGTGLNEEQMR
jgi:hypothetical protein